MRTYLVKCSIELPQAMGNPRYVEHYYEIETELQDAAQFAAQLRFIDHVDTMPSQFVRENMAFSIWVPA